MLFRTDRDRRVFLSLLGELEPRFGVRIIAYVLMGNHYHLILTSENGRLSDAMHFLDGRFARYFNQCHQRDGAFFRGRFKSELIRSDDQLERAGIYLHLNPVKAGLVDVSLNYRWSSLRDYAAGRTPLPWLHLDLLRDRTGTDYASTVLAYSDEIVRIDTPVDDPGIDFWGDDNSAAEAAVVASDEAVAALFGASVDDLYSAVRGRRNIPRMVAIAAAASACGLGDDWVAHRYGLHGKNSVRTVVRRLRAALTEDLDLAQSVRSLGLAI